MEEVDEQLKVNKVNVKVNAAIFVNKIVLQYSMRYGTSKIHINRYS